MSDDDVIGPDDLDSEILSAPELDGDELDVDALEIDGLEEDGFAVEDGAGASQAAHKASRLHLHSKDRQPRLVCIHRAHAPYYWAVL